MLRRLITSLTLATVLLAPAAAWAGEAEGFVKSKQGELVTLLKKADSDTADKKVESVFDRMLDYTTLAKESLDSYWDERTAGERAEFEGVLKRLVQKAYRKSLKKTLDYEVVYQGETPAKKGFVVKTVAKSRTDKRQEPIRIDYVLHKVDGQWRIYDIVTEGSSLVNNYRSQFRRVIKKQGFDELLRRMKQKLDDDA